MLYEDIKNMKIEQFPLQTFDKVRYADTDRQGHVNNSVFSQYFETGRVELLYNPLLEIFDKDCSFVIVSFRVDYLKEISWPGNVNIGTGVLKVGTSSIKLLQALYQDGVLVATSETVIVQVCALGSASHALSVKSKDILHRYLI